MPISPLLSSTSEQLVTLTPWAEQAEGSAKHEARKRERTKQMSNDVINFPEAKKRACITNARLELLNAYWHCDQGLLGEVVGVFGPPLASTPLKTLSRTDWISLRDNTPSPSVSARIIIIRM